jgi:uncharacterized protein YggT (Ycf19 family)/F0F1-type ATP synthase membrane subunit c/vacuolar-type H+-ATPase subunit K
MSIASNLAEITGNLHIGLAALGSALAVGIIGLKASEAVGRNPGAATPILVQLLWVNYVWPELFGWPNSFFAAACVALAIQSIGYLAETFRGGIEAIPKGQLEAAYALGMSHLQVFFRIVLSWFPLRPGGIVFTINQWLFRATEPLMGRARRILPPMGQFDLSPIVVILFLQIVVGRLILGC